jgi:2-polyprenyl-3-methyl-5-hydroxy-6-metoxy-1,4-benzoquinol methylase
VTQYDDEKRDMQRFARLTFEDFRTLATDESLSPVQKIGFPESYRAGAEESILADITSKLPALEQEGKRILDIGPGCSPLAEMLLDLCERRGHELVLVDSPEMLAQLADRAGVTKVPGAFPDPAALHGEEGRFDAILAYSVLHYVFVDANPFAFLDRALELLAHGGALLLGDVPNASKRKRFLLSPAGVAFHQRFMQTAEPPLVEFNQVEPGTIDDAAVLGLVARARAAGGDAYVLPLGTTLPLANRREDILVVWP